MHDRIACCVTPKSRCGTRFAELRAWVCKTTGKGVKVVEIVSSEQGNAPFYAQRVGFDGRSIYVAQDAGCDTEKLLHEVCHFLLTPKDRRQLTNYGLGPGTFRNTDEVTSDNEELTVQLLEKLLAPHFLLPLSQLYKPDYNVANRRNLDWQACEARAEALYAKLVETIPPVRGAVPRADPLQG